MPDPKSGVSIMLTQRAYRKAVKKRKARHAGGRPIVVLRKGKRCAIKNLVGFAISGKN